MSKPVAVEAQINVTLTVEMPDDMPLSEDEFTEQFLTALGGDVSESLDMDNVSGLVVTATGRSSFDAPQSIIPHAHAH